MVMSRHDNTGKIFCGGLSLWTTSQGLKEYFTSYGGVKEASVVSGTDPMTGEQKSRGFGFVVFEDPVVCEEVIKAGRLTIDQKSVEVKAVGGESPESGDPCKCFAGGLPASCDSAKLREYFSKFDQGLTECNVLMDPTGKSRCFGYVTFSDPAAARAALEAKDSHYIDGKWIDLKVCQPKGKGKGKKGKEFGGGKGFGKGGGGYGKGGGGYGGYGGYAGGYEQAYAAQAYQAAYGAQAYAAAYAPQAYAAPTAYAQPDYSAQYAAAAAQQAYAAAPQQAYAAAPQQAYATAAYAAAPQQGAAMYARQAPY